MELQQIESTASTEYDIGPNVWVYHSWTNPAFCARVERFTSEIGGMNTGYRFDIQGELPSHEINVLAGKLMQITNGGRG
jgi:hypothetical protein